MTVDDVALARCREVCARFNAARYYALLGMEAASDAPGTARVTLRFDERLTQIYGGIHGGALLSLADAAINVALATTFEHGETNATVELGMHFLAPAPRADVEARATLTRRGGRLAFGECVLLAEGAEIARGRGICRVVVPRTVPPGDGR
jgi:uncharacterized protein (TIGR00369 family)